MARKRASAELLSTFVLVFGGVGTAVLAGDHVGYLGVAFAFGLSLLAMAYAVGRSRAVTPTRPSRVSRQSRPAADERAWGKHARPACLTLPPTCERLMPIR